MIKLDGKDIYIVGDIHSNLTVIGNLMDGAIKDSVFIQVGDFGIGFSDRVYENKKLQALNTLLREKNNILLVIRGNHDDPSYYQGNCTLSNLKLLPDYSYAEINSKTYLFIGGALSIDRLARTPFKDYWPNEGLELKEELVRPCDVLITHTKTSKQYPQTFSKIVLEWNEVENKVFADRPQDNLLEELKAENFLMDRIFLIAQPKQHFYGHFHTSRSEIINGCECKLLDINEVIKLDK